MKLLAVLTTVGDRDAAHRMAADLVRRRLAACVQIEVIESVYEWQGALHDGPEWRLVAKTTAANYRALEAAIREQHPYELPAIWAQPVDRASAAYARWVAESTAGAPAPPGD